MNLVCERRGCKARLQNVGRASIKVTVWDGVTSKALHSACKTFPTYIGNTSAWDPAAALWERCISVAGKFLNGCLKGHFSFFISAKQQLLAAIKPQLPKTFWQDLRGSHWIPFLSGSSCTHTNIYVTHPLPMYHFDPAYGYVDLDQCALWMFHFKNP